METEYIEKQAAIEAVNSVPAADWVSKRYAEALEKIPPADVRPVVRESGFRLDTRIFGIKQPAPFADMKIQPATVGQDGNGKTKNGFR